MTAYTILREVLVLQPIIASPLLSYAFFGAGFLLIGAKWLFDRETFQLRNIWLLTGFVAVSVISVLINFKYDLISNIKAVGWMSIYFFLIYTYRSSFKHNPKITPIFVTAVVTMSVLVAVSLPMYFLNIGYRYAYNSSLGSFASQGFSSDYLRLWGVFQDPNYSSVHAIVVLMMVVYLFSKNRKLITRVLLVLAGIMMVLYMVLSGSRTAQLSTVVVGAWAGFYLSVAKINASKIKKIFISAGSCVLAAVICCGAFLGVRFALPYLKHSVSYLYNDSIERTVHTAYDNVYRWSGITVYSGFYSAEKPDDGGETFEELNRVDIEAKDDVSNGRIIKWGEALKIFSKAPILGTSPRGIVSFAKENLPHTTIAKYNYSTHNSFFDILTGTGLVGFLVVLFVLLKIVFSTLRLTFKKGFNKEIFLMSSMALMLVTASFFMSDLFFILTFGGIIFWMACGSICYADGEFYTESCEITNEESRRILVYGLKDPAGGLEKIVFEYVRNITPKHNISFDFILFGKDFSMQNDIEALGCRCLYVPSRKSDNKAYKKAINTIFAENKYTAVWGNYSGLTNIDVLIEAKKQGTPIRIAHSHVTRLYWGSPIMKYVVYIMHTFNKLRLDGYATHYWACSEDSGRFMYPRSAYDRIEVINNAADCSVFYPNNDEKQAMRRKLGIGDNVTVIGHVARLCEVKNQSFLLKVMSEIVKLQSDAKLLIVGDGELWQPLHDEADKLNIRDNIIFTGTRTDVPALLRAMDVFVLPSLSEGLSVSAVEAQASGLPCVVSSAVSEKTNVSGAVKFVDLKASADVWAKEILAQANVIIEYPAQKLAENGYDISVEAEKLYNKFVGERNEKV